jgi:hypothetical protein
MIAAVGFIYHHLEEADVRAAMVAHWRQEFAELTQHDARSQCYGRQLTDAGWVAFEVAMPEALTSRDDDWLVSQMASSTYWLPKSPRRTRSGVTMVNYNKQDALDRLCLGEFNIAYIRGLAHALRARGETECIVYRANPAYEPRGECSAWEGRSFSLDAVLTGHRARYFPPPGDAAVWSVPSGPHCHHSIRAVGP